MPPPTYVPNRSTATARLGWETKSSESLGWYALTALASDNASADTRPGAGFWMVAPIPVPTPERSSGGITLYWSDMLGDHNLVTMAQVNGRISDFAALVAYVNRKKRLNWSVGAQQIPYIIGGFGGGCDLSGNCVEEVERLKTTSRDISGIVAYPFNRSDRIEASAGFEQISFAHEIRFTCFDPFGNVTCDSTQHLPVPGALNMIQTTAALVHDNSFYGATGPILGSRWRLEADPTFGNLRFITAIADYRKYIMPVRPFTIAARVLHIGRYGRDADDQRMYPLFIGYPSLVRGYDIGSFGNGEECVPSATSPCPISYPR